VAQVPKEKGEPKKKKTLAGRQSRGTLAPIGKKKLGASFSGRLGGARGRLKARALWGKKAREKKAWEPERGKFRGEVVGPGRWATGTVDQRRVHFPSISFDHGTPGARKG